MPVPVLPGLVHLPAGLGFGSGRVLAGVGVAALLTGCWVAPPRTEDFLAIGFRTPEQAFRTFQTGVRADEPSLEYRCFSSEFTRQNHLSQYIWREARDEMRKRYPWLRKGIADAEITSPPQVHGARARMQIDSHGHAFDVELVSEGFGEIWAGPERVVDENVEFGEHTDAQVGGDGRHWFSGRLEIPPGRETDVSEVRVGREWKIDAIQAVEAPVRPAAIRPRPSAD